MPQQLGAYDVYGTLGKGTFCRVRFAVNRTSNFSYAIKIFDKAKLRENGLFESTKNEIAVMKTLDNRHCVGIRDMFASKEKIYLVLDLMMGGSLSNRLKKKTKFTEERTRHYFQQIVSGVEYCHHMSIIIGGLCLEGILVDGEGGIKISDFGCAVLDTDDTASRTSNSPIRRANIKSCSSFYMAPEMVEHNSPSSRLTDVWSLGVLLFAMNAGHMPFDLKPTLPEMLRNISNGAHEPYPEWFSTSLVDLLDKIFITGPSKRATVKDVMGHEWMQWDSEASFDDDSIGDETQNSQDEDTSKILESNVHVENFCGEFINKPLQGLVYAMFAPFSIFRSSHTSSPPNTSSSTSELNAKSDAQTSKDKLPQSKILRKLGKHHQGNIMQYDASEISISGRSPSNSAAAK